MRRSRNLVEIKYPAAWAKAGESTGAAGKDPDFVRTVMRPMLAQQGDKLPVSAVHRRTGSSRPPPRSTRSAASPSTCPSGSWKTASSATSAPSSARTRSIRPFLADRGGAQEGARRASRPRRRRQGAQGLQFRIQVEPAGLHGLRQLRGHLPGQEEGAGHEAARDPDRGAGPATGTIAEQLPVRDSLVGRSPSRAASSASPCSSSPGPAPAAARRPTSSSSPSSSATA